MATASSDIIPREQLSAWQRWELAALVTPVVQEPLPTDPAAPQDDLQPALHALREEARAAGYAEGRAAAAAERALLREILARLAPDTTDIEQARAEQVLDLAIVLARALAGAALAVRPEAILPIVQQALRELPGATERVDVMLHPADLAVVTSYLDAGDTSPKCQLIADPRIIPGGCRVATEQCDVDATVPSRWKRLTASLGHAGEWLVDG